MAVPKRRQSKTRQSLRQQANKWRAPRFAVCPECGSSKPTFHVACHACGSYRRRKVIAVAE